MGLNTTDSFGIRSALHGLDPAHITFAIIAVEIHDRANTWVPQTSKDQETPKRESHGPPFHSEHKMQPASSSAHQKYCCKSPAENNLTLAGTWGTKKSSSPGQSHNASPGFNTPAVAASQATN
eukprot:CAMPEP_0172677762 /NCGR_PEP_ID=MMETSP1074-20121228/14907_1 /TAXON_ID=2916 /ORGANISM="Ceratium fusus, Strain PA161109" /LENGTH=122 /DNA_ID=CAMNT_0013495657 /DNA_START=225 /DNA_END=594 /DNA_ORIENTATION=+